MDTRLKIDENMEENTEEKTGQNLAGNLIPELRAKARRPIALLIFLLSYLMLSIPTAAETVSECLSLLSSVAESRTGLELGRTLKAGEPVEPVLLWSNPEGTGEMLFRDCSEGSAMSRTVSVDNQEPFSSALVARFTGETVEGLPLFREAAGVGVAPDGMTKLEFKRADTMLEARRLASGSHVEITGTAAVQILPAAEIPILLIASRQAMDAMELEAWEEAWGDQPEDSQIGRQIIWWELLERGELMIHPVVETFAGIAQQVDQPADGRKTFWRETLADDLADSLAQDVISLFVADKPDQVDLAEAILDRITSSTSDAGLDIARLEKLEKKVWSEEDLGRLELASERGRHLRLVRFYDLAAIMPDRVAGKIRRNYRQSIELPSSVTGLATKTYAVLGATSDDYRVANAIFQDQAAGMASTVDFLGCLLKNEAEPQDRRKVLMEGLRQMNLEVEELAEMNVNRAFQFLFQGFSLPAGMRAGERSLLGSISRGDSEVSRLVFSLQSYFEENVFDAEKTCELALIPDAALLGGPFGETVILRQDVKVAEAVPEPQPLDDFSRAKQVKNQARLALRDAIYTKGAKHTRKKIEKGHKQLDKGDALLRSGQLETSRAALDAIAAFEKAERIFVDARETAFKIEHQKPKLRVH